MFLTLPCRLIHILITIGYNIVASFQYKQSYFYFQTTALTIMYAVIYKVLKM